MPQSNVFAGTSSYMVQISPSDPENITIQDPSGNIQHLRVNRIDSIQSEAEAIRTAANLIPLNSKIIVIGSPHLTHVIYGGFQFVPKSVKDVVGNGRITIVK